MDGTWALLTARELGVELSLNGGNIRAHPASRITPELRTAVRENKQTLIKDLLMRDALRFLNEHYIEGANLCVLDLPEDRMNEAYHTAPLGEFRATVREYVRAGLREFRRAREAIA